ncbi:MAG: C4-dicarboxylate ABC transporter substrate-binding protein, partial [Actinobacteria bacterium]|nr:C4-dicarboxylate ABC transporter substrate-binding protein [Actinomycetota bacterium]
GVEAMKFYEVAPSILLTRHAITIRPLCFSVKTLKKLPADLQDAILKAGKEAGVYGRQVESSEDQDKLDKYAKEGKLKQVPFSQRAVVFIAVSDDERRTFQADGRSCAAMENGDVVPTR